MNIFRKILRFGRVDCDGVYGFKAVMLFDSFLFIRHPMADIDQLGFLVGWRKVINRNGVVFNEKSKKATR